MIESTNVRRFPSSRVTMNIDPPTRYTNALSFQAIPGDVNSDIRASTLARNVDVSLGSYTVPRQTYPVHWQDPPVIIRRRFLALYVNKLFSHLGRLLYNYRWKVIIVCILILSLSCLGLKNIVNETDIEKLWTQDRGTSEENEIISKSFGSDEKKATTENIIQSGDNLLTVQALKDHLKLLMRLKNLVIHHADRDWKLRDICQRPQAPFVGNEFIQSYIKSFMPCRIWSPLDCFWDGSKVLDEGPISISINRNPIEVSWLNLNPLELVSLFNKTYLDAHDLAIYMEKVGITKAYLDRPCLDPTDPECPNKSQIPNVAKVLKNGCSGFAAKIMRYPLEMLVGGIKKENSQLKSAKSLHSLLFFKSPKDLMDEYMRFGAQYTPKQMEEVVRIFKQKIKSELVNCNNRKNNLVCHGMTSEFYSLGDDNLKTTLSKATESAFTNKSIFITVILLAAFSGLCFLRWRQPVISHVWLVMPGVIVVFLSIICGLSLSAFFQIQFNALTYQLLPFLLLGKGFDNIFLLTTHYSKLALYNHNEDVICDTMVNCGPTILYTSLFEAVVFLWTGLFIDAPLIKSVCFQIAIVTMVQMLSTLTIYPSVLSIDLLRRKSQIRDFLCCLLSPCFHSQQQLLQMQSVSSTSEPSSSATQPERIPRQSDSIAANSSQECSSVVTTSPSSITNSSREASVPQNSNLSGHTRSSIANKRDHSYRTDFITKLTDSLVNFLSLTSVKICLCIVWLGLFGISIYGIIKPLYGLSLSSVLPTDSIEQKFFQKFSSEFGIYTVDIFTYGTNYCTKQADLRKFHDELKTLPNLLHIHDQLFWLDAFREWAQSLQDAYYNDLKMNRITRDCQYNNGVVSDETIIAQELILQYNSAFCRNPSRTDFMKPIVNNGIIKEDKFYFYLKIWYRLDIHRLSINSEIYPQPTEPIPMFDYPMSFQTENDKNALREKIRRTQEALNPSYVKTTLFFTGLNNNSKMMEIAEKVRNITNTYKTNGLKNFPRSLLLVLCDQFFSLTGYFLYMTAAFVVSFIILSMIFMNICSCFLSLICSLLTVLQICGLFYWIGCEFNTLSTIIVALSVGFAIRYQGSFVIAFNNYPTTSKMSTDEALKSRAASMLLSGLGSFLGIVVVSHTEFQIIYEYFFLCITLVIAVTMSNGFIFVPIVFSCAGLTDEDTEQVDQTPVIHYNNTPPPPSSLPSQALNPVANSSARQPSNRSRRRSSSISHSRPSSLSTISEEPSHLGSNPSIISTNEAQFHTTNTCRILPSESPRRPDSTENNSQQQYCEHIPNPHHQQPYYHTIEPLDTSRSSLPHHPCCSSNPSVSFITQPVAENSAHNYSSSTRIRATAHLDVEVFNCYHPGHQPPPRVHCHVNEPNVTTNYTMENSAAPNPQNTHYYSNVPTPVPLSPYHSQSQINTTTSHPDALPSRTVSNAPQFENSQMRDVDPPPYPGL